MSPDEQFSINRNSGPSPKPEKQTPHEAREGHHKGHFADTTADTGDHADTAWWAFSM